MKSSLCLAMLDNLKSSIEPLNDWLPIGFWPIRSELSVKSISPDQYVSATSSLSSHNWTLSELLVTAAKCQLPSLTAFEDESELRLPPSVVKSKLSVEEI